MPEKCVDTSKGKINFFEANDVELIAIDEPDKEKYYKKVLDMINNS
ncbi:hypothetical protein SAMN05216327_101275 [Dyadobacter sp. SG02]|nr:hypothetical protein SAMN05216327_101275 [Dyadobacter sp. SG02]